MREDSVNILLVDDQPAKLLTYEAILRGVGERLLTAASASEALEQLLRNDIAVVLIDVCMPETDGFELASMIRDHPRFQKTAIIFISAIVLNDVDRLRGYEMGAVDYIPVPIIPEVLRAKVKVFAELFRTTRKLEQLNHQLEARVAERTAELAASTRRLAQSEQLRALALAAGRMGSWEWDAVRGLLTWDRGQHAIFGVDPEAFKPTPEKTRAFILSDDVKDLLDAYARISPDFQTMQTEFRVRRENGEIRWCLGAAAASLDDTGRVVRLAGVTVDITERREAEARQVLLAREVDHRARNTLAIVQSMVRLTRAETQAEYVTAVEARIRALSTAHTLLSDARWEGAELERLVTEELAPYQTEDPQRIVAHGPSVRLEPTAGQILGLALHELATNAAKYGALRSREGRVTISWQVEADKLMLFWVENGGPAVKRPARQGYGTSVIAQGVGSQLDGQVRFDWPKTGLRCALSFPVGRAAHQVGLPPRRPAVSPLESTGIGVLPENRVLLVEDEILISMMLSDMLADFGFHVVGPFGRMADALRAARERAVSVAVLDVNLGGESTYAVAEVLADRGVPVIFITGYGAESIDSRFADAIVLQKPIDPRSLETVLSRATKGRAKTVDH